MLLRSFMRQFLIALPNFLKYVVPFVSIMSQMHFAGLTLKNFFLYTHWLNQQEWTWDKKKKKLQNPDTDYHNYWLADDVADSLITVLHALSRQCSAWGYKRDVALVDSYSFNITIVISGVLHPSLTEWVMGIHFFWSQEWYHIESNVQSWGHIKKACETRKTGG